MALRSGWIPYLPTAVRIRPTKHLPLGAIVSQEFSPGTGTHLKKVVVRSLPPLSGVRIKSRPLIICVFFENTTLF